MTQYVRSALRPILAKCPPLVHVARILVIIYLAQAGVGIAVGVAYALWLIYLN